MQNTAKRIIGAFMISMLVTVALAQNDTNSMIKPQDDFGFSIDIDPSFTNSASILISHRGNADSVDLVIRKDYRDTSGNYQIKKVVSSKALSKLTDFIPRYRFETRKNDEIKTEHINVNGKDSIIEIHRSINDGTEVKGEFAQNGILRRFKFTFVHKEDKELLNIVFDILYSTFTDKQSVEYLNDIKKSVLN